MSALGRPAAPVALSKTTHFYTENCRFEQSLDVYPPRVTEASLTPPPPPCVVLLVVGSGWVGHHWSIYRMTSWWNSSGPKTIAMSTNNDARTTCICIRHSGAFCYIPSVSEVMQVCTASSTILYGSLVIWVVLACMMTTTKQTIQSTVTILGGVVVAVMALVWSLAMIGKGSASLDTMMQDVAQAVAWVLAHRETWDVSFVPTDAKPTDIPMILGGYSSGGHVVACLLHRPDIWNRFVLPDPVDCLSGILYISGVLAVQPHESSISATTAATTEPMAMRSTSGSRSPRWLTDFVMYAVWGPHWSTLIPSPIALLEHSPPAPATALPHLILGNRREMWGVPWLDVFFCAEAYADQLQRLQRASHTNVTTAPYVQYRSIPSDHWNILHSWHLRTTLSTELALLVRHAHARRRQAQ